MNISIKPDAASKVEIVPGTTPSLTGAMSFGCEIYFDTNSINGQYEVPVYLGRPSGNMTAIEIYRTPPDDGNPNHLIFFYRNAAGSAVEIDLGDSSTLYGKWIHFAWTQSSSLDAHVYIGLEGGTPGSWTYLATPALGTITHTVLGNTTDTVEVGEEKSASDTTALTTSIARFWCTEAELSESQISGVGGVWTQKPPTSAITSNDHLYLPCDNPGSPGNDTGNPGTNWTATGTFSAGHAVDPTSWVHGSVNFTTDQLSTTTFPTQAGPWHWGGWTKVNPAGYNVAGLDTSLFAFGRSNTPIEGMIFVIPHDSDRIECGIYANDFANLYFQQFITGGNTNWFAWIFQYPGSGTQYTLRWRFENDTSWNTITLDCGFAFTNGQSIHIADDQYGEPAIDCNHKGIWCQETTASDSTALASSISARQGIAPTGTNVHWLPLDAATDLSNGTYLNRGTAGAWTITNNPVVDADEPDESGGPTPPALRTRMMLLGVGI